MDQTTVTVTGKVTFTGRVEFTEVHLPEDPTSFTNVLASARALLTLPSLSLAIPRFLGLHGLARSSQNVLLSKPMK